MSSAVSLSQPPFSGHLPPPLASRALAIRLLETQRQTAELNTQKTESGISLTNIKREISDADREVTNLTENLQLIRTITHHSHEACLKAQAIVPADPGNYFDDEILVLEDDAVSNSMQIEEVKEDVPFDDNEIKIILQCPLEKIQEMIDRANSNHQSLECEIGDLEREIREQKGILNNLQKKATALQNEIERIKVIGKAYEQAMSSHLMTQANALANTSKKLIQPAQQKAGFLSRIWNKITS